ncbi:MAG TPA: hypothetical protein VEC11_05375 [Allosphingosinicella sp.]|nr:hypothetical protein [Allosphingosinicella sp.]
MKKVVALALIVTTLPLGAAGASAEGRPETNERAERRVCTQITVRAGSRMSGRRICKTQREWREVLGPDWRQHLAGARSIELDYDALMMRSARATSVNEVPH